MSNSRRTFIKTVAAGIIGTEAVTGLPSGAFAQDKPLSKGIEIQRGYIVFDEKTQKTMRAFADAIAPGSNQYGIDAKIMEYVNRDRAAATFFDAGLWNVEAVSRQYYKKSFHELTDNEEITKVVSHVRSKNLVFFNQFRYLTLRLFYADPKVWEGLSYDGPPQTKGFMDYADPPKP